MIILGIDPALTSLGWGVAEATGRNKIDYLASGLVKTTPEEKLHLRLAFIVKKLDAIIALYKPDIISLEETFVNKNALSSMKLGYVRGAIMALVGNLGIELVEFKPNFVKKALAGSGHADKNMVSSMLKLVVGKVPDNLKFDEADALALAYTCFTTIER